MSEEYLKLKRLNNPPRLPLKGSLDLTYRCNNNCRHCWLNIPLDSNEKVNELSLEEIKGLVDEAKKMGCRKWSLSGGEPMARPDFIDIFDYITRNSASYSLNTNATLITPKIARLMKRKGTKMVVLYGATADVHDHITRNPGSFEATMRGFAYLKEQGAGFMVQLIPMRDNYHQFKDMVSLAESLSRQYKTGAAWLYLSACGDPEKNKEIMRQRLPPKDVVELDKPDLSYESWLENQDIYKNCHPKKNKHLFANCINARRDFHIDPYGRMSFCCFIKDPALRYDLRRGSLKECWDEFIPSLANAVVGTEEYLKNCGSCELRKDCRWCPVYGYLEHRNFSSKTEYLCVVARENKRFKDNWQKNHRRYYRIADITIQLDSDLPITDETFHPRFKKFEVDGAGEDTISIRHHFSLPDLNGKDLGKKFYEKPPWAIYKKRDSWVYLGISPVDEKRLHRVIVFNQNHTRAKIYNNNDKEESFLKGGLHSLTLFPTDQILLARILADREGFYLHACGVNFKGRGLLFVGNSDAGKSTIAAMLKEKAEIFCDDRMIIKRHPDSFRIHGTWSHGDIPEVSANAAPLSAILFLEKAKENKIVPLEDKKEKIKRLLSCLIKPFITSDWWEKTISLIDKTTDETPCCVLKFDRSGEIVNLLNKEAK